MRVDPEQADDLVLAPEELRYAAHRSRRHRMFAANDEWDLAAFQGLDHLLGGLGAGLRDLFQIARARMPGSLGLSERDGNVAGVFDLVSELFQPRFQSGD